MAPLSKVSDTTVPVAAEAAGIPGSAVVPAANTHARPASPARRNHRARAFPRQACGRTLSVAAFRAILLLDTNTAAAPPRPGWRERPNEPQTRCAAILRDVFPRPHACRVVVDRPPHR